MAVPKLNVRVLTPTGVLYEGEVLAVSGTNATGPFAILPQHAQFISLITGPILLHEQQREAKEITLEQGVLACQDNKVEVYAGFGALTL